MTEAGRGASGFVNWGWVWASIIATAVTILVSIFAPRFWELLRSHGILTANHSKMSPVFIRTISLIVSPAFISGFVFGVIQVRAWKQIPLGMIPWLLYILISMALIGFLKSYVTHSIISILLDLTYFPRALAGSAFGWLCWKLFRHIFMSA